MTFDSKHADQPASGNLCSCCGTVHESDPRAFHVLAPAYWSADHEGQDGCELTDDLCIIDGEFYFVRGLIEIPVRGQDDPFAWGAWVSLSEESFARTLDAWETPGRESTAPMFGWLSCALPGYRRATLGLKTMVHTRPVGLRPLIEVEPTRHRLAREQRKGITPAALARRLERLLPSA